MIVYMLYICFYDFRMYYLKEAVYKFGSVHITVID